MTQISMANSTTNNNNTNSRKIVILSDMFTVRLIKSYVQPLNFLVKPVTKPHQTLQFMEVEQSKRCIFFDYEYGERILKYIKDLNPTKRAKFILVAIKPSLQKRTNRMAGLSSMTLDSSIDYFVRKPL